MKYSPVGPLAIMQELHLYDAAGDYLLLLAQEVHRDPDAWAELIWAMRKEYKTTVIMDNGVIELGRAMPITKTLEACQIVDADFIVLPDVLKSAVGTIQKVSASLVPFYSSNTRAQPIGVIQGTTLDEVFSLASWYSGIGVEHIALPRLLTDMHVQRRRTEISHISRCHLIGQGIAEAFKGVHMLGFSDDLGDDFLTQISSKVMGIDSAMPIWAGNSGIEITAELQYNNKYQRLKRPNDYMNQEEVGSLAIKNVQEIRRWLR